MSDQANISQPQPVYACVHAPEFAVQSLLRLRHSLRRRPVAVLEGHPPLERICSANSAARRDGVVNGMTKIEAESFAGLALLRRSQREESEARSALLTCAGKYTPGIEDVSMDWSATCVLDLTGTEKLFGPALSLTQRLADELSGFGLRVSIACSANFHAAIAVARSGPGISLIPPGEEQQALAPLFLDVLPLTADQRDTLALWGIRTLGGLAALPEKALVARIGQPGKRLRALARGHQPHLFQPAEPGFVLSESYEFDSPVAVLDSLLFVLSPMLDQLVRRAGERALSLASITVLLQLDHAANQPAAAHQRIIRPALPTSDRKLLLKLLQLDLATHPPAAAVISLQLTAEPGSESRVQLGLFSPQLPESSRLDVTLARLRALVGEDYVGSPQLEDTHAPDSFLVNSFAVNRPAATAQNEISGAPSIRRIRPPAPIAVRLEGSQLTNFWYDARQYRVTRLYGPWRESGDWWSAGAWSRELWDLSAEAATDSSDWRKSCTSEKLSCVAAYDLLEKQWTLEAIYD